MGKKKCLFLVGILVSLGCGMFLTGAKEANPTDLLKQADEQFEKKNYKDAENLYREIVKTGARDEAWHQASRRIIMCNLRLQLFDKALSAAEDYVKQCAGTPHEARAERQLGNLFMLVPHWGTRQGGKFLRSQHTQGIYVMSERHDRNKALEHTERARDLYAKFDGDAKALSVLPKEEQDNWHNERIDAIFDLANIYSRFGIYENAWNYWYSSWGERDDFVAETAGEDDFDEYQNRWQLQRKRPLGLRLGADGRPAFPRTPKKYSPDISDDEKIFFLLQEARDLDQTKNHKYAALSWYRQAMLSRTRFGMDRLNGYASYYYDGGRNPLQEDLEKFNPWEMKDSEALILAGGEIGKVTLPEEWDVLSILRDIVTEFPDSGIADQAQYAIGLYYQTRQQYLEALREYAILKEKFKKGEWVSNAGTQIGRIKASQAHINQMGVQLPGEPAKLQLNYRNISKVWFVARRIELEGFLETIRNGNLDSEQGIPGFWSLGSWHSHFVNQYNDKDYVSRVAAEHLGEEAARWTDEVKDDGTHRYAEAMIQTPLSETGAYLIYAYLEEPSLDEAKKTGGAAFYLGVSRAVCVLSDVAIVEKKAKQGNLYFICNARTGAPIPQAAVDIIELWSEYNDLWRKNEYHKKMHNLLTDKDGMVVLENPPNRNHGNLHVLVRAGNDRLAWSGMSYFSSYHPSGIRDGLYAYCITDRPVYRPSQTVRFKVWMRHKVKGEYQNQAFQNVSVDIYDPKGNKVYSVSKQTDEYGGLDGELVLSEEPPLGVYRMQVGGVGYAGGANFRVEEYKKPEFEVTVEPGKTHQKLGEKIQAKIKATYYFGGPVTDATVSYKVFREEYVHSYYFPGPWDWLYGSGYGLGWYEYPWFSWWGKIRRCWAPPSWWWGAPRNPVRELVDQGEARIGEDGTVSVEIDTAPALRDHPDRDHRYVIQADVRDASRRVITGEGAVKATRQAFYAFVESDRGYARPGEEMKIRVRCLTPGNEPVKTGGLVTISRVVFGGPGNAHIEEKEIDRWKAETDERGILEFQIRQEKSGQLKIKFEAPDKWQGAVEGYGLVWVCGEDFDGELYRFNNLEIITDKRTYQPGETAHVMINTSHSNSYVLFSDELDNSYLLSWKLLHLPKRHTVLHIPITKEHRPNFFLEATTVTDARVHQQMTRICVPPEEGILTVNLETDKAEYQPGEKATVSVSANTPDGKPAKAQIALSIFDKSVLYIQEEFAPRIAKFFHGNVRYHNIQMITNLLEQLSSAGYVERPFQNLYPLPPAWFGLWGPTVEDWRAVKDAEMEQVGAVVSQSMSYNLAMPARGGEMKMLADASKPASSAVMMKEKMGALEGVESASGAAGIAAPLVEAQVRKEFADTALWLTTLVTGEDGKTKATFTMPENLTTWKISAWGMTPDTRVGQESTSAVTTKNLLVRLQAPRFFLEYDEVVISANVHNYLEKDKTARVSLDVPGEFLQMIGDVPQTTDVKVTAGGESRVDWRVKVLKEGSAAITVKALTDEESDAMQMKFPVLVHGITKQVATTGSMRPEEMEKTVTVELDVPEKRRPELTTLDVMFAPSLVGAMMDAIPYCIYYPYGCTEQTMSRFLPCVLTLKTLQNMGISLEDIKKIRGRMEEVRKIEKGENISLYIYSPIFDEKELDQMIRKGLSRITSMQKQDGGWGWWTLDDSDPYLTCYVLYALCTAQQCDVKVDDGMIQRGMDFIARWEEERMREEHWTPSPHHAYVAYVLSMKQRKVSFKPGEGDTRSGDLIERLYEGRDKLNLYGKALLTMALANLKDMDRAKIALQNIMQCKEEALETQVAWFRTPDQGWWHWWNSDIETNATILRAIMHVEPKSDVAPRIVKWLLNNRRNGYYWNSTRDTTLCVAAMSEFAIASGETDPDFTLTLDFDGGAVTKTVKINKENFFTYDNRFYLEGVTLGGGKHTLKITKKGPGALYFNTWLKYFTREEHITAAGHELKLERSYFKLQQIPYEVEVEGSEGQKLKEKRLRYERIPVKYGDTLQSGDTLQVELKVTSDNDYTYLCFEDMKPAGCEPTEVKSGGKGQEGFYSYMELRDEKTVFFVNSIGRGEHLLRYRLRAEIPGVFHALPTVLYGMYAPTLRANSEEHVIKIVD